MHLESCAGWVFFFFFLDQYLFVMVPAHPVAAVPLCLQPYRDIFREKAIKLLISAEDSRDICASKQNLQTWSSCDTICDILESKYILCYQVQCYFWT